MSDWKPGDVAMVKGRWQYDQPHWELMARKVVDGWAAMYPSKLVQDHEVSDIRPLVVIDPEDAEQVERLAKLLWPHYSDVESARLCKSEITADALREFANPTPRIEEPTGLGAVVEDERGKRWVRTEGATTDRYHWSSIHSHGGMITTEWSEIDAVRVLTEGVPS